MSGPVKTQVHRGAYADGTYPTFLDDGRVNCLGVDTEAFFPLSGELPCSAVQRICAACELGAACREWAIAQGNWLQGYWGGTTPRLRRKIRECRTRRASHGVCRHGPTCPLETRFGQEAA